MATRIQTHAVAHFSCLGDQCPDTCCKGWGMQLTTQTLDTFRTQAPELLDAVTSGEAEFIMKRDPVTDYCVKFDAGWCSIHRDYGPEFLGDACNFYPRVTRALDDTVVMSMALSCPEAARAMLYDAQAFTTLPREDLRVPFSLRNYLPEKIPPQHALAIHRRFIEEAGSEQYSAEHNLLRLMAVTRALEAQPPEAWEAATPFYFTMAEGRIPAAEADIHDLLHLAQALMGLIFASSASNRGGLMQIAHGIQTALGMSIDAMTRGMIVAPDAMERGIRLLHHWKDHGAGVQPALRRYLQGQISQALFPFAGLGDTPSQRLLIIAVRFATVKLALMAHAMHTGGEPAAEDVVRITYTLSRFLDHLADPALSLAIYQETGWVRDARLRALLGA